MRKLIPTLILLLVAVTACADDTKVTISYANCESSAPCIVIKNGAEVLSDAINSDKSNSQSIKLIEASIAPQIDFRLMTANAVGANWKKANKEQQDELVNSFKQLLINTYATALSKFKGASIDINSVQVNAANSPKKAVVKSLITLPVTSENKTPKVTIEYSLAFIKGEWKVYEVKIEGISLIVTYRNQFNEIINESGIDGLITQLQKKVIALAR